MSKIRQTRPESASTSWTLRILGSSALIGALILWPRRARASSRRTSEQRPGPLNIYGLSRYAPRSAEAVILFTAAARHLRLPESWASTPELHAILEKESGGYVGRPNFHFGDLSKLDRRPQWPNVWKAIQGGTWRDQLAEPYRSLPRQNQSSATGLGQLTSTNIPKYYPSGLTGIGNELEEAIGMLAYIADRYGSPQEAWARYDRGY